MGSGNPPFTFYVASTRRACDSDKCQEKTGLVTDVALVVATTTSLVGLSVCPF